MNREVTCSCDPGVSHPITLWSKDNDDAYMQLTRDGAIQLAVDLLTQVELERQINEDYDRWNA